MWSEKGGFPVNSSRMAIAYEYVSAAIVGDDSLSSIISGANHRALPLSVKVADTLASVTSSMSLDIPKSQIQASPYKISAYKLESLAFSHFSRNQDVCLDSI